MKNTDIKKIRELLKTFEWIHMDSREYKTEYFCPACKQTKEFGHYKDCSFKRASELLPCKTCNGTGKLPRKKNERHCSISSCCVTNRIRKIWLNGFFRLFILLPGTWIFPFAFIGLNKDIACLLYLIVFFMAVYDNDGVWWRKKELGQ